MKQNIIKAKSFDFALKIICLTKELEKSREFILSKQILRSGTSIGALIRESVYAESKADFIHKLSVSLKEANETKYWLDLLYQSNKLESKTYVEIHSELEELLKLLTSIIKSAKSNLIKHKT
jgi:four helix bundle protein